MRLPSPDDAFSAGRLLLATAVAVVLLVASGCGDDGGSGTEAGTSSSEADVSKAEYVDQVNGLCTEQTKELQGVVTPAAQKALQSGATEDEARAAGLEAGLSITERTLERAAAVPRPAEDAEALDDFWSTLQGTPPLLSDLVDAIRAGDTERLQELQTQFEQIGAETRPFAIDYGLTACVPAASGGG